MTFFFFFFFCLKGLLLDDFHGQILVLCQFRQSERSLRPSLYLSFPSFTTCFEAQNRNLTYILLPQSSPNDLIYFQGDQHLPENLSFLSTLGRPGTPSIHSLIGDGGQACQPGSQNVLWSEAAARSLPRRLPSLRDTMSLNQTRNLDQDSKSQPLANHPLQARPGALDSYDL